ncbi:SulP family inorganic anion transporter [Methylococcus sp. Mc7]|uniref:SulP family inorganic anion transporter n=1 Tax=Methylococcus sp. Mc7 TaxID=2860258 RepID=UPI001C52886B|nr:SulP family inorganic anion transporter [Methylococcus sp. Mc7]QXP85727.1 SulP family inorganic anion transporter [Methylococcus sp. Mc7]
MNAQTSLISTLRVSWKEDLLASIVVFLVALPLSMGIAIASGIPMEKAASVGLITAIIGGIVVGPLSGSPLQVSGPAAGLAVMVAMFIQEHGFETLGLIVLLGGLIQLAAGLFRLGQVFRAVSPALIQGMLAGIGVLIFASQFHVMVDDVPPGTGKEFGGLINLWSLPLAVWKGISETVHRPAALIGVLTIATVMLWTAFAPKRLRLLPAPLIGVVVATACAAFLELDLKYVPVPDQLLDAVTWPTLAGLGRLTEGAIWLAGLSLAFVGSAESLLTATAVDSMQRHAPRTKYDRELAAQGAGNILCGLLGVLPITGVIVRSSANVLAGARTRLSAILHGVWMLVFIALLPAVLSLIPVAALAAVLVYTGIKLTKLQFARILWGEDRAEAGIYAATLGTVVMVDLLTGVAVGIGLALARLLYSFSHLEIQVEEEQASGVTHIHLKGAATFMRLPQLAAVLEKLRPDAQVHVHFDELTFIDHACLDLLVNWEQQHQAGGGELVIDWENLHGIFQRHAWGSGSSPRKD